MGIADRRFIQTASKEAKVSGTGTGDFFCTPHN